MPIITFQGPQLTREQKAELARELTGAASRVTGMPENVIITLFEAYAAEDVATGGQLLADRLEVAGH